MESNGNPSPGSPRTEHAHGNTALTGKLGYASDRQNDAANRLDWKGERSGNPHAMAALILVRTWTHEGSEGTHGVSPDRRLAGTISNVSPRVYEADVVLDVLAQPPRRKAGLLRRRTADCLPVVPVPEERWGYCRREHGWMERHQRCSDAAMR